MMDYRQVFEQFKMQYVETEGIFDFGLFPLLFLELKTYGADRSIATTEFAKDFHEIFLKGAKVAVLQGSIEHIAHYSTTILPATVVRKEAVVEAPATVEEKKVEAKPVPVRQPKEQRKGVGIDYQSPVPREEDEGDPLYTPPEERLDLKPEDCADPVTDWGFLDRINAVGSKS